MNADEKRSAQALPKNKKESYHKSKLADGGTGKSILALKTSKPPQLEECRTSHR